MTKKSAKTKSEEMEELPNEEQKTEEHTLDEKYVALQEELAASKDKWLRIAAEFENFRRRSISEKSDWIKNANKRLILEICNVVDNFERALMQKEENGKNDGYEKGIDLIYQQLLDLLKKEGVTKIESMGKDFDPQYHEALTKIPSDMEEDKIVAVIQNGYMMNDKVIQAARVAVSNGTKVQKKAKKKEKKQDEK